MKNNENPKYEIQRINTKIICIYLTIFASLLFLIIYYKERATLIDQQCGTNFRNNYPDTTHYNKIIVTIFILTDSIFLYYAYTKLQDTINRYKKTGDDAGLDSSYNSFYANLFEFTGTLIILYNIVTNKDSSINSLL
ncbi:MAG: hypothetical protein PHT75_04410 [Bacilli bacterium]|nr:hypothetical protein [Bacilli bacterium]MDD3305335.1 hypothetical protein [Bacilli bacterium]MDD4053627.1 hypothetical protein [Bacilli bacterium]MDD4411126.1 hypothetical protein [Bacilli bacterium]